VALSCALSWQASAWAAQAFAAGAWQLSGLSGIAWAVAIAAVSLLVASYLVLALQQLMGPAAALLYPPLAMMIALPLMMAALLERRSASPIA
jgi:hypothetical protein